MTEAEAKTKWCPFVRILVDSEHWQTNRPTVRMDESSMPVDYCIASNCMAWRWSRQKNIGPGISSMGYCGLASRPDEH